MLVMLALGIVLIAVFRHPRVLHVVGILFIYAALGLLGSVLRQQFGRRDGASGSRAWARAVGLVGVLAAVVLIVLTVLNTGGAFYRAPKPKQAMIRVKRLESNYGVGGSSSDLTTLPYLVIKPGGNISYAVSAVTARTIRAGGTFTCTITKPVDVQIARASKCNVRHR